MAKLLFDEPPIAVSPTLAAMFCELGLDGLAAAAFVQQINMSCFVKERDPGRYQDSYIDGFFWCYNSYASWLKLYPFFGCVKTLQRLAKKLEELEVIIMVQLENSLDRRNRTRVNMEVLDRLTDGYLKKHQTQSESVSHAHGQNDRMDTPPDVHDHRDKKSASYTKNSSETSSETSNSKNIRPSADGRAKASAGLRDLPKHNPEGFQRFWSVYPNKVKKQYCIDIWDKIRPDATTVETMVNDIHNRPRIDKDWRPDKDGKTFIPHPSAYLNAGRWTDELEGEAAAARPLMPPVGSPEFLKWREMMRNQDVDAFREKALASLSDAIDHGVKSFTDANGKTWTLKERKGPMLELLSPNGEPRQLPAFAAAERFIWEGYNLA